MERQIKIRTKDNHTIYGALTKLTKRSDNVIVFVTGMSSHMGEHQFFNAARYFPKRGFAVFRFNLYDWQKDARQMMDCTIKEHASDIEVVVSRMKREGFERIFLVGHSYGGPSILLSNLKNVDGIVLWDPTDDVGSLWTSRKYLKKYLKDVKSLDAYIGIFGVNVIIGRKMRDLDIKLGDMTDRTKNVHVPIKFILAGKGMILIKGGRKYYRNANAPKSFKIIKNATHNFDEEGTEEKLFKETLEWVKKYS